ncbi:DNA mismatch repair protein MutT [Weizmannia acidilactici]|uniref:DNA mismatch repair protein MutT n=1 Tax=Weizmannia acidilactici TaxID=2607726 RepID=A0A5J4JAF4_9BACI|nr:NUDIX hydrolase [Weizmannia acidilactici]GER66622.1 DNA mismatch repair protein MutT [Weizmannia acidilactici]GER68893.1 DNA mismatch repair protein MutT [Weizmannia acidilactici]GER73521.1 DNA mismatch repair protein MutT [Weizmannia acidilactici]
MGYIEEIRKLAGSRPLILPGSVVLIFNGREEILLQQRVEPRGVWGLPGGLMELGESAEETALREVYEETGLRLNDLTLFNLYSGKNYFVRLKNGDQFFSVTAAFISRSYSGEPSVNLKEGMDIGFFPLDQLPAKLVGSHRRMIEEYKQAKNPHPPSK